MIDLNPEKLFRASKSDVIKINLWEERLPSPHKRIRRLWNGRGGDVNTWFVSTMSRLPGEKQFGIIWSMQEFDSELLARGYAKDALNNGLRVEAGTLPEIRPDICVRWREAEAWATPSEAAPCLAD
jgi:hypothetical protein